MNEGKKTCGKPSRGRYRQGCRCFMCRAANSQYEYDRSHGLVAERDLVGEAETEQARKRVEGWRAQGIGLRTIELWTGVHRSSLQTLVLGNHPNAKGRTRRMSRENYEAIMGCDGIGMAPNSNVDSAEARDCVKDLPARGWTKVRIADESGVPYQTLVAMTSDRRGTGKCSAKTAHAIVSLHREAGRRRKHVRLEDWQWAEARADFAKGTTADVLAERYGVSVGTIKDHMRKSGVAFAQQASFATASIRR